MRDQGGYLESINEIPEPHTFTVQLRIGQGDYSAFFEEHEHAHVAANRDNNMRALWVILAVLALRPSLPVYPQHQTFPGPVGTSHGPIADIAPARGQPDHSTRRLR
jgi:hypothetical protein